MIYPSRSVPSIIVPFFSTPKKINRDRNNLFPSLCLSQNSLETETGGRCSRYNVSTLSLHCLYYLSKGMKSYQIIKGKKHNRDIMSKGKNLPPSVHYYAQC